MSSDQKPNPAGDDGDRKASGNAQTPDEAPQMLSTGRRGFFRLAVFSAVEQLERLGRAVADNEGPPPQPSPRPTSPRIRRPDDQVKRGPDR